MQIYGIYDICRSMGFMIYADLWDLRYMQICGIYRQQQLYYMQIYGIYIICRSMGFTIYADFWDIRYMQICGIYYICRSVEFTIYADLWDLRFMQTCGIYDIPMQICGIYDICRSKGFMINYNQNNYNSILNFFKQEYSFISEEDLIFITITGSLAVISAATAPWTEKNDANLVQNFWNRNR